MPSFCFSRRSALLCGSAIITVLLPMGQASAQTPAEPETIRTFEDSRRLLGEPLNDAVDRDGEAARFERWEYRVLPRLMSGGRFPKPSILLDELQRYERAHSTSNTVQQVLGGNWKPLGPTGFDALNNNNGGTGRVSVIRFAPNDTNSLYVGTPDGGAWRSTNAGASWTPLTDKIPNLGVSDIAIDPKNPATIYLATGDAKDAGMYGNPYSYGVLKSTNSGVTWQISGLSWDVSERVTIPRLVVSPTNSNVLLAGVFGGTHRGIQKSNDAGKTWTQRDGGSIYDIQYNPADPTIVYASGYGNFRRSTDGGDTWTTITSVLPTYTTNNVSRTAIGVTPADPSVVYVLYISHTNNQIYGLYKSTDKGVTFAKVFQNAPTIFGNYGEYNLVFSVSPRDANYLVIGEQTLGASTNGGATWKSITPALHVDNHAFVFTPSGSVEYCGNDGGIARSANGGTSWKDLSPGLSITQYYRVGGQSYRSDLLYAGAQDNGISRLDAGIWSHAMTGADGGDCAIDPMDENTVYMEFQQGYLYRSDDAGQSTSFIAPSSNGHWITPFLVLPRDHNQIFAAYTSLYHSTDKGDNWVKTSAPPAGTDNLKSFAVSESDSLTIYAGTYVRLFRSSNLGTTWTDLTSRTPTSDTVVLTSIVISPTDSRKVWLTYSGFTDHQHLYATTDGGETWNNITGSLPNVPVNTAVYEPGSHDGIYIGTDLGVYYRDSSMNDWEPFNKGLPNVSVSELEIHDATGILRAATFGRGMWESPLRSLSTPLAPVLRMPQNDTVGTLLNPAFTWGGIERANAYTLEIALDSACSTIVFHQDSIASPELKLPRSLEPGTRYYWHARATNVIGTGQWSQTWDFTTSGVNQVDHSLEPLVRAVFPNPAARSVTIEMALDREENAHIALVDILGRTQLDMDMGLVSAGPHQFPISVMALPNGSYGYLLTIGQTTIRGRVQIMH